MNKKLLGLSLFLGSVILFIFYFRTNQLILELFGVLFFWLAMFIFSKQDKIWAIKNNTLVKIENNKRELDKHHSGWSVAVLLILGMVIVQYLVSRLIMLFTDNKVLMAIIITFLIFLTAILSNRVVSWFTGKKISNKSVIKILLLSIIYSVLFHSIFLIDMDLYNNSSFYATLLLMVNLFNNFIF